MVLTFSSSTQNCRVAHFCAKIFFTANSCIICLRLWEKGTLNSVCQSFDLLNRVFFLLLKSIQLWQFVPLCNSKNNVRYDVRVKYQKMSLTRNTYTYYMNPYSLDCFLLLTTRTDESSSCNKTSAINFNHRLQSNLTSDTNYYYFIARLSSTMYVISEFFDRELRIGY